MLQSLLYQLKRAIHSRPAVYSALYQMATINLDYINCLLRKGHYPSEFGGFWTDLKDPAETIDNKFQSGQITTNERDALIQFSKEGFFTLQSAIPETLIDRYLDDLKRLQETDPCPLKITSADLEEPTLFQQDVFERYSSIRTVDDYFFLSSARDILFHDTIERYLTLLFEKPAVLTQTLSFLYGSQQAIHQDTAFVRMTSPNKLIGLWIALEDVTEGSGELIYYPGSHRWPDYLFSGYFKHYDEERDGLGQLHDWYHWISQQAAESNTITARFRPRKGDVLFWHAGLAHGGDLITNPQATRRSLVGHFCPRGVRPLYHYYKPAQRRIYRDGDRQYSTSYYT